MNWAGVLGTPVVPLQSGTPKVMDLPAFDGYSDPKKLDVISKIAEQAGRDPQLATVAVNIFRQYRVPSRDYRGQAAALLKWVQQNVYYVNEPDERLQDPFYTLKVKYGDCDDLAILVYSLARSVRLPAKLVISGTTKSGKKVRYHHGDRNFDRSVNWSHIYLMVGDRPYGEPKWFYAEPTLNVPLGWDVVSHNGDILPEMQSTPSYGYAMAAIPVPSGFLSSDPSTPRISRAPVTPGASSISTFSTTPSLTPNYPTPESYIQKTPEYAPAPAYPTPGLSTMPSTPRSLAPSVPGLPQIGGAPQYVPTYPVPKEGGVVAPQGLDPNAPGFQFGGNADGYANAVAVLLVDRKGRILLLHRAPGMSFMGNAWDLPGGQTSPAFPARPQAADILFAETGIRLPEIALVPLLTAYHPSSGTAMFFVAAVPDAVKVAVRAPEHTEFRWVSSEGSVEDMMLVPYMPLVLDALRRSRGGMLPSQYGAADMLGDGKFGLSSLALAVLAGFLLAKAM